ncbi:glycosyltransferase [Flavobacterium sp. GNP001]
MPTEPIATSKSKTILVAPLNWGLGHATRCIPIIKALLELNYQPIIASDGAALLLLQREFPDLKTLELPSYEIEYAIKGKNFKWHLLKNSWKTLKAIREEKALVKKWITTYGIDGIISDNRLGVFNKNIPSAYLTHQIQVLSGQTTWISSKIHQYFAFQHNECWIPDYASSNNLSGILGHIDDFDHKLKYIGPISRLQKKLVPKKYDLLVLLSGPEPQRSMLETHLLKELQGFEGTVLFVAGTVVAQQKISQTEKVEYYNFMTTSQLEQAINESEMVLCRSGYTSIMDLSVLRKKAFFIPTPGQFEQEYLAEKLEKEGLVPYVTQDEFCITNLQDANHYKGLPKADSKVAWEKLFGLFEE